MGITYECIKNVMNEVPTPCYIVSEALLEKNLKRLRSVSDQTGCKILLAQKAFSMYYYYPLIGKYLDGVTASGLYEARLGYEELCQKQILDSNNTAKRCENHVFSPAYHKTQTDELFQILSLIHI